MKDINMKKLLTALTLTTLTSTVVNAAGYGVVDLERVVENSTYLKQQNSSFQQKIQPQSTKLDQLSKELQDLQQRLQTGDKLSAADKQKMVTQYQTKMNEFNTLQQTMQSSVQSSLQQVFDGRVKQVAEQLRKENQLDVVLNKNSALAYDAKYDLTDKMIQKVNAIK